MIGHESPEPHLTLAEFDEYADGYQGGMEDPIKRFFGASAEAFIDVKVQWLLRDLIRLPLSLVHSPKEIRLLDFGCGIGSFLQSLNRNGFSGQAEGCDLSEKMIQEARKRWKGSQIPSLHVSTIVTTPFEMGSFDLVTACCVFHHIPIEKRQTVFSELARILKPGGRLVVFEHNPLNLLTQLIVRRAPIDRHAILLYAGDTRSGMKAAGLNRIRTNYFLFFPLWFRWLQDIERRLCGIPFGGQYVVVGEKR